MVKNPPQPISKQSPEDGSMKDGLFKEGNTQAPASKSIHTLFSLKHRTAIISGGDRGIGLNVAEALAEAGADVAIWYNSNEKAHDRAADIEKTYGVKCRKSNWHTRQTLTQT
jgi:sorbose reductase